MPVDLSRVEARREALRVSRLAPTELNGLFNQDMALRILAEPLNSPVAKAYARRQKPQFYGRLGILVARSLEQTFDSKSYNGVPRLIRLGRNGTPKEARTIDRNTWDGLQSCWADTFFFNMVRIIEPAQTSREPWLSALAALAINRMRSTGSVRRFDVKLQTDALNAATQSLRLVSGMSGYQQETTTTLKGNSGNIEVVGSSPQPLFNVANLSANQLTVFEAEYLGCQAEGYRKTYGIHPNWIAHDIYRTIPGTGRIALESGIEGFPVGPDMTVGDVPVLSPGPAIGCPMMLRPELAGMLWRGITNSAGEAGLI